MRAICAAEVLLHTLPSARLLPCSLRGGSSVLPRTHAGQRDASGPRRASRLDRHPRRAPVSFLQTPAPWPPRHRSELFPSPSSPGVARGQAQGNRKPRRESVKETPSSRIPLRNHVNLTLRSDPVRVAGRAENFAAIGNLITKGKYNREFPLKYSDSHAVPS